jgi:hypothetical protein
MGEAREVLDEIQRRTDPSSIGIFKLVDNVATDVPKLVASLRAVLDAEESGAWRTGWEGRTDGTGGVRPWDMEAWLKGYVFAREEMLKAITEALGGTDA